MILFYCNATSRNEQIRGTVSENRRPVENKKRGRQRAGDIVVIFMPTLVMFESSIYAD